MPFDFCVTQWFFPIRCRNFYIRHVCVVNVSSNLLKWIIFFLFRLPRVTNCHSWHMNIVWNILFFHHCIPPQSSSNILNFFPIFFPPTLCARSVCVFLYQRYDASNYCITCVLTNFASSDLLIKIAKKSETRPTTAATTTTVAAGSNSSSSSSREKIFDIINERTLVHVYGVCVCVRA